MDMVKFSDLNDPGFQIVCGEIQNWVDSISPLEASPSDEHKATNLRHHAAVLGRKTPTRKFVGEISEGNITCASPITDTSKPYIFTLTFCRND